MSSLSISPGLRFYREVCRCIPFLIDQFDVDELTDKHALRRVVAERFSQNKHHSNPDVCTLPNDCTHVHTPMQSDDEKENHFNVFTCSAMQTIDLLILKGRQELEEIMQRYKNRHHVINQWITDPKEKKRARESAEDRGLSPWLEKFLESNYEKPNPV